MQDCEAGGGGTPLQGVLTQARWKLPSGMPNLDFQVCLTRQFV